MPRVGKIHAVERTNHAKRFGISFPRPGRTPYRIYFETKAERDRELKKSVKQAVTDGAAPFTISAGDVQMLKELREILPADVDPRSAARFYMEARQNIKLCSMDDARREYLKAAQLRKLDYRHLKKVSLTLDRLMTYIGKDRPISEIDDGEMLSFLTSFPFAQVTIDSMDSTLRAFFGFCVKRQFCSRSPMDSMDRIAVPESEPSPMPVTDVKKLFNACSEVRPMALPMIALSFFAGMRSASILRLRRDDINFKEQGILLPGKMHKTGRRFYVEGFEPNLWEWLEPWRKLKELKPVPSSTFIKWRAAAVEKAKIEFPSNTGRDSFCTYHIALKGNASETASLLTHRGSVSMMYNHYRGNATKAEAQRFFKIRPAKCS